MDWYAEKCREQGYDAEERKQYEINLAWAVYWLLKRSIVIILIILGLRALL